MSAHTPGPWMDDDGVVYSIPLDKIVMKLDKDGREYPYHRGLVALVYGHQISPGGKVGHGPGHVFTYDANARLIAAAPELLASLLSNCLGCEKGWPVAHDDGFGARHDDGAAFFACRNTAEQRAAIRKATEHGTP